jgi:hypothetical protein
MPAGQAVLCLVANGNSPVDAMPIPMFSQLFVSLCPGTVPSIILIFHNLVNELYIYVRLSVASAQHSIQRRMFLWPRCQIELQSSQTFT